MNDNLIDSFDSIFKELKPLLKIHTVYFEGNPVASPENTSYKRKLKLELPSLKQIDSTFC